MAHHNDLGKWGEEVAREYLITHGYAIFASNVRIGKVEIDIVASQGDTIVFCEVKTRATDYVDPVSAIDDSKRRRMIHAADVYMRTIEITLQPRFDLIFIIGTPESYTIEHIPDAFFPTI